MTNSIACEARPRIRQSLTRLIGVWVCLLISSVGLAQGQKPLNKKGVLEVTKVVAGANPKFRSKAMNVATQTVNEFGVDFQLTSEIEEEIRAAGGDESFITAVRTNYRVKKTDPVLTGKSTAVVSPPDPAKVAGMAAAVEAYQLQYRGFHSNAVPRARQAVAEGPKNAYAHAVLGYVLAATNQFIEGEKEAREALRLDDKSAIAYLALGLIHLHQGRYDEAEQEMKYAITLEPNLPDAYNDIGVLYLERNRTDEAEQSYIRAVSVAADNPVTRGNLSFLYLRQRRFSEAEAQARRALELEPDYYYGRFTLGESLAAQSLNYKAAQEYKEAVRLKPDCAECHSGLGIAYVGLNRYAEAAEALVEAIRLNPNLQAAHAWLGLTHIKADRYADAIKSLKRAIQLQFEDAHAHYGLAVAYLGVGSKTAALEEYNIVKNLDQKLGEDLLAFINKASSAPTEPRPNAVSDINSQPAKTVTLRDVELSFTSNLFDEAIRNARIFLETTPNSKEAHAYLGLSLLIKKDVDNAVNHMGKAVLLGEPITLPVLRLREPLLGHGLDAATVTLTADSVIIKTGRTSFQSNFSSLSEFRVANYNNQCPIVYFKGVFVESSENSQKSKQGVKQFNLFPPSATLQPVQQGTLVYNMAACNDDGTVTLGIMKLLNRIMSDRR